MVMKTLLIAFLGATLCLDRICLQLMISRPIVTAPVIGLVLGDMMTGLLVGAFVELLWVDRPAIGNYVPPNDSLVAVVVTGAAILAGSFLGGVSRPLTVFALLVLLPLSYVTQRIEIYLATNNNALSDAALKDAEAGNASAIERKHLLAIGKTFLIFAVFILLFTALGVMVLSYTYPLLPAAALRALDLLYYAFPCLMVAVALNSIKLRGDLAVFSALVVLAVMVYEWLYRF